MPPLFLCLLGYIPFNHKISPSTSNWEFLPWAAVVFSWKRCAEEMDVSMHNTCRQDVVEGLFGRGLEWWKLRLHKVIRISPLSSSFPSCSPLWLALSSTVNTRKKQNPTSPPRQKGRFLEYFYEKHFLHNFLHVWKRHSLLTIKRLKLIRSKVYTLYLSCLA